jgi:predicted PurR-regulated permease PerM
MDLGVKRIEFLVAIVVLALLAVGCLIVLLPFIAPILWALIVTLTTWPAYRQLRRALRGRRTLAAAAMTLLLVSILLVPLVILATGLADDAAVFIRRFRAFFADGIPAAPDWLIGVPLIGGGLANLWAGLAEGTITIGQYVPKVIQPVGNWLVRVGVTVGQGVFDLSMGLLVAFFLYRDGDKAAAAFSQIAHRIGGERSARLTRVAEGTMKGVVYGIVGTAFAQGILTAVGLGVAGVPAAIFLGVVAGFASLIPGGAALVWIPAAIWLFAQGYTGWGIFLVIWGAAIVGTADNVLKPMFISRGSALPFIIVLLGVVGGMLAFGFLGIFLGPTLLAVGYSLVGEWTRQQEARPAEEPVAVD